MAVADALRGLGAGGIEVKCDGQVHMYTWIILKLRSGCHQPEALCVFEDVRLPCTSPLPVRRYSRTVDGECNSSGAPEKECSFGSVPFVAMAGGGRTRVDRGNSDRSPLAPTGLTSCSSSDRPWTRSLSPPLSLLTPILVPAAFLSCWLRCVSWSVRATISQYHPDDPGFSVFTRLNRQASRCNRYHSAPRTRQALVAVVVPKEISLPFRPHFTC